METSMPHNLHNTLQSFKHGKLYSLPMLGKALNLKLERLPVSIRIVLESVLRNCDGKKVTQAHVRQLAGWQPNAKRTDEIPFVLSRIVLQDFTGVPLLCDLAAMRGVARKMGKDPKMIEPLVPVDLVVDHSVQIDHYGTKNALDLHIYIQYLRHEERARPEPEARIQAQRGALPVHEVGHAGFRHLQGGAAGHRHRAPEQ